jgi:hypothetical protein
VDALVPSQSDSTETLILEPNAKAGCGKSTNAVPDSFSISTTKTFTVPLIDRPQPAASAQ